MPVRTRYAPSPTGALHPGNARTALFSYLVARKGRGQFLVRIEDTDRARLVEGSLATTIEGLRWLGITWDEGPDVGGPHEPYVQSQRLPIYQEFAQKLLSEGHAYRCFCTEARLAEMREAQQRAGRPTRYDGHCRNLPVGEVSERVAAGERSTIRMRVPEGKTVVDDLLRGPREIENSSQDDSVLLKSDGYPTYHLAAIVDDHLMSITHVVRGEEWLGSFAKHVMLYQMLGWTPPVFAHVPVVLGPDRAKLSKRHGAASLLEYRDLGYLPEAMVNFLAFLGWSPGTGEEIFDLEGLATAFDLEKVQVSPAIFDIAKLDSVNGQHIRRLSVDEFTQRIAPFTPELSPTLRAAAAPLIQERIQRLTEATEMLDFLVNRPLELPEELVPRLKGVEPADRVARTIEALQDTRAAFESAEVGLGLEPGLRELAGRLDWKAGDLFMMLRIALTGRRVTPPLLESAALLGQAECLVRLDFAIGELISRSRRAVEVD